MDQAILALLGVIITLMLYLDRGRRADLALHREETQRGFAQMGEAMQMGNAQLREEMQRGDAQLREETQRGLAQLREETQRGLAQLREEMLAGFARLADIIMDLCQRVSRLEVRADTETTPAPPSQ